MSVELIQARHPAPWRVEDLRGKYYGTVVLDANGQEVISIGNGYADEPHSARQHAPPEGGFENFHWESASSFAIATWLCEQFNRHSLNSK